MFVEILSLVFIACLVQGQETNFDTQLKLINKPSLKSFQTEHGDIIDCVDIYKQLAFDHPMLKNHKIQMKPETPLKQIGDAKVYKSSNYMPKNIKCPPNSVPIKRATREDLKMVESIKSLGVLNHPPAMNTSSRRENLDDIQGHEFAMLVYKRQIYGSKAVLNVWNPVVQGQQFSLGGMGLATGPVDKINTLQAGWLVHGVLSPNASRFFTFWSGFGYQTGCFNTLCPGFVQVSPNIAPGLVLRPSTFDGSQTEMYFGIYQDKATKNWWLMVDDKYIGYWPKELIPEMTEGAQMVWWGGEVYSPAGVLSSAMGSGHWPEEGYSKSAYVQQIKVINDGRSTYYDGPTARYLSLWVNKPYYYNAIHNVTPTKPYGRFMYFGGPGNYKF